MLAVKPGDVAQAARAVADAGPAHRRSPPVSPHTRSRRQRAAVPVVRAMPNTPALVRAGAAAISPAGCGCGRLAWAEEILAPSASSCACPRRRWTR